MICIHFRSFPSLFDVCVKKVINCFVSDEIRTILSDGTTEIYEVKTQCKNCEREFSNANFDAHVCEYSDSDTFIYDDEMMKILWEESSLRKMYMENNKIIDQILDQSNDTHIRPKEMKNTRSEAQYLCSVCHRMYVHPSGLLRHTELHHNKNEAGTPSEQSDDIEAVQLTDIVKCLICGRIFNSLSMCFLHLEAKHAEFGFDESESSLTAESTQLYEKLKIDQVFQCEFCDLMFADTSALFQHKMSHDIATGYECSSCELASRNLKFILMHRSNECPYEMYEKCPQINCKTRLVCSDCEDEFSSLAQLYEHRYK